MEYEPNVNNDRFDNWLDSKGVLPETRGKVAVAIAGMIMTATVAFGVYESITTPDVRPQCDQNSVSANC